MLTTSVRAQQLVCFPRSATAHCVAGSLVDHPMVQTRGITRVI